MKNVSTGLKSTSVFHKELLKTPAKPQTDKKIKYVRYADDFLTGVNGSREDLSTSRSWPKVAAFKWAHTFKRMVEKNFKACYRLDISMN